MLQGLERVLLANWEAFGGQGKRPDRFRYVLFAGRHWHSKAVIYCLPEGREGATLVVKVQRENLQRALLESEYRCLLALHEDERLQELRPSIPRPLFLGPIDGHLSLIETYMPGVPFSKHARRRDPELFLRVTRWLGAFHRRTVRKAGGLTEAEIGQHFLRPLESAMPVLEASERLRLFLDGFRQRVLALAGTPIALVVSHNDLCTSNIRFPAERIGVIDWEFSRDPDLPLFDLLNAFLFFVMTWQRLDYPAAFRAAFSGTHEANRLLDRCLRAYVQDLGLSPGMLQLLVVQYLISRIPFLESLGDAANAREAIACLEAIADGQVDLGRLAALAGKGDLIAPPTGIGSSRVAGA
jgi:hypothetical protein